MTFDLTIITPTSNKTIPIVWIEINTSTGGMIIQKGHCSTISILKENKEFFFKTEQGAVESMEVTGGIAEIKKDAVTIIINK